METENRGQRKTCAYGRSLLVALTVLTAMTGSAVAQQKPALPGNYPVRPVKVIISSAPGGGADFLGRLLFGKLGERWASSFHVENVASGVNGVRAMDATVKAAPDGYTLLVTSSATFLSAAISTTAPYDVRRVTRPIAQFSSSPLMMGVHPGQPYRNLKEFLVYAKGKPGGISYGVPGLGSGAHLAGELMGHMAGINMVVIPYKGAGQAAADALGGRIPVVFGSSAALYPHVKSGKLLSFGISTANRVSTMPDQATLGESGLPGFEYAGWFGVVGPGGMPESLITALNHAINNIIDEPEVHKLLTSSGVDPQTGTPDQFLKTILSALQKAETVIKATGLKLEE